ncbi:hypothetical protein [Zavarzinella formosa]|uniref:hypothetical protein n=1 Tax=Zavarzinella formosa TaxID=360055 RepID=UPI0002D322B4|nr:hypothetical protein [Zavarzinella formosa]
MGWLVALSGGLLLAGVVACGLAADGRFLPHDEQFLGMSAGELCERHGCRIVHFMIHDRAAFGGVVASIGLVYLWLALVPLRRREGWAWRALLVSGIVGFASFLAHFAQGYFDVWHGAATLTLLPCYVIGMWRSRAAGWRPVPSRGWPNWRTRSGAGRACLLAVSIGSIVAGVVILSLGMTEVFVPQDLAYLSVSTDELRALNPRLVPLIAHDRVGFGGAMVSAGLAATACVWHMEPHGSAWWVLALGGAAAFGPAIAVHYAIGYTDPIHLAPAIAAAALHALGLALMMRRTSRHAG